MSHAFLSIEGVSECYACGELAGHADHAGHEPRPDDAIGSLCALVTRSGGTMTLYGVTVTEDELRQKAEESVTSRIADRMAHALVDELGLVLGDG